jgi:hypothetical protein
MTIEAVHSQYLQQDVNHQRIICWNHQLDVSWMAWAFESLVPASCADGIAFIWGDSEQGIVKPSLYWFLLRIINLWFFDFTDTESP